MYREVTSLQVWGFRLFKISPAQGGSRQQSVMSFDTVKGFELPLFCFLFEFCREGEPVIRQCLLLQIGADSGLSSFFAQGGAGEQRPRTTEHGPGEEGGFGG